MKTQRFNLVLATDGDVSEQELADALDALGYHGVMALAEGRGVDHECPCPSWGCIRQLQAEGHEIPEGTACCVCWGLQR